jgi:outer membrane protein TolC
MRTPKSPLLLALSVTCLVSSEEPKPSYRPDLPECIAMALSQSPRVKASLHDVALAEARLDEARSGRQPRVEALSFSGAVPEARGNAVYSPDRVTDPDDLGPFTRLDIDLVQPVYTFGKIRSYIDAALHGLEAEKAKRQQSAGEIVFNVKRLYYSLLLNRQLVEVLSDTEKSFQKAHDRFQALIDEDEGKPDYSMLDFVKLKVGLAQVSGNLQKLRKAEVLTRSGLVQALGLSPDADFDIKDKELRAEPAEILAEDQYVSETFKSRPEWKQLQAGIQAKESLVAAAKKDYFPECFVAVPFRYAVAPNRDDQKNPFVYDEFNYLEGGPVFGLRWQFSLGGNRARLEQAKAELRKLLAQRDEASQGLPVEVQKALFEVLEMKEQMDLTNKTRKFARGLLASSAGIHELGVQDLKELFESYGLYTKAASDYHLAVHAYNLALAELSKTVGTEVSKLQY